MHDGTVLLLLGAYVVGVLGYFLPGLIASKRKHRNSNSIALANLFFGWTLLGWLIVLVSAFSDNVHTQPSGKKGRAD